MKCIKYLVLLAFLAVVGKQLVMPLVHEVGNGNVAFGIVALAITVVLALVIATEHCVEAKKSRA